MIVRIWCTLTACKVAIETYDTLFISYCVNLDDGKKTDVRGSYDEDNLPHTLRTRCNLLLVNQRGSAGIHTAKE